MLEGSWNRIQQDLNNKMQGSYLQTYTGFWVIPAFYFSRLLHDRELDLFDGTRLMRWDRYQMLKEQLQFSDQQLQDRYIYAHTGQHVNIWSGHGEIPSRWTGVTRV